ncbi:hypothetical protein ACFQBQ_04860 [Granulicella cerasi]|uniref:Uncharacterized protein n=1 Tax=Granulicella cerasi TaxID=741063 RepID=A0ABW1Z6X6_9BACT
MLLESITIPDEHKHLTLHAEAPLDADIDGVVGELVRDTHDISALGRKVPAFDPGDDLT